MFIPRSKKLCTPTYYPHVWQIGVVFIFTWSTSNGSHHTLVENNYQVLLNNERNELAWHCYLWLLYINFIIISQQERQVPNLTERQDTSSEPIFYSQYFLFLSIQVSIMQKQNKQLLTKHSNCSPWWTSIIWPFSNYLLLQISLGYRRLFYSTISSVQAWHYFQVKKNLRILLCWWEFKCRISWKANKNVGSSWPIQTK